MPVIAKLSRLFYERLGDQIANELVECLNQVDSTSRADLRELNELNFARFDAKLEQRVAEINAKIDQRIAEVNVKFAAVHTSIALLQAEMQKELKEHTRWMLLAWATQMAAIIGLWIR